MSLSVSAGVGLPISASATRNRGNSNRRLVTSDHTTLGIRYCRTVFGGICPRMNLSVPPMPPGNRSGLVELEDAVRSAGLYW